MSDVDIPRTLAFLRPGESFVMNGDQYSGLEWLANTPKPSEEEIADAYPAAIAAYEAQLAAAESGRRKIAEASGLTAEEMRALGFGV